MKNTEPLATRLANLAAGRSQSTDQRGAEAAMALEKLGAFWSNRLARDWRPPTEPDSFPWEMTRLSLEALLPGLRSAEEWRKRELKASGAAKVCGLILAGNTPLMSWSPMAACLLAGHSVFVKMSSNDTLWPRLFVESLAEVAPEIASRILIDFWPGDDPRTAELAQTADILIAFGSDSTLEALGKVTPAATPFIGYGHSISVGIWTASAGLPSFDAWLAHLQALGLGFARDTLMYGQAGCLSPQVLFLDTNDPNPHLVPLLKSILVDAFPVASVALRVPPVTDAAVATAVRRVRDVAEFGEADVYGSDDLEWTLIIEPRTITIVSPAGHSTLTVIPFQEWSTLSELFGAFRGRISSAGVAGHLTPEQRLILEKEGISRVCVAGEMQAPPLDWPNGGFDLLAKLGSIAPG